MSQINSWSTFKSFFSILEKINLIFELQGLFLFAIAHRTRTLPYRAYSSCFMHVIVACMRLPFFKIFSNFVHFCPNFQIFCSFFTFFLKNCMHALSRIGLALVPTISCWLISVARWIQMLSLNRVAENTKIEQGKIYQQTIPTCLI